VAPESFEWILRRLVGIFEVAFAFALVHLPYRALKHFTVLGQWDAQTNFIPGLTMTASTVAVLVLCRRSFAAYGLSTKRWGYHLNLGLACSLLLLAVEAVALTLTKVHIEASTPPDPLTVTIFAQRQTVDLVAARAGDADGEGFVEVGGVLDDAAAGGVGGAGVIGEGPGVGRWANRVSGGVNDGQLIWLENLF
jgi:hypothetical protein